MLSASTDLHDEMNYEEVIYFHGVLKNTTNVVIGHEIHVPTSSSNQPSYTLVTTLENAGI
jgi:hypothetical protein